MPISAGARLVHEQDVGVGGVGGLGPAEATHGDHRVARQCSRPGSVPLRSGGNRVRTVP